MVTLNMVQMLAENPEVQLRLLVSADELESNGTLPGLQLKGIPVVPLPWKRPMREALWLGSNWPPIDRYLSEDFWVYCSMETYVPVRRCRRIVTVHHLEPAIKASPFKREKLKQWRQRFRVRKAIANADLIVAQSSFTAREIILQHGVSESRLVVVGCGVDQSLLATPPPRVQSHGAAAALGSYIISVGAFQLRKGTDYLFAMARELQRRGSPLKIVCPFGLRGVSPFIDEVKVLTNVVALDYTSRDELLDLIRGAVCMVIPSRLEGFGLPAIESMALGTPVIASNNSAMPETLGGAGILVDPADATALTDAVERLLKDALHRANLANLGRLRAENCTWARCMERLLAGIAKVRVEAGQGEHSASAGV
jgi:glycosyltransferase involved in cell wall biosynthesis